MSANDREILLISNSGPVKAQRDGDKLTLDTSLDGTWQRVPTIFRLRLTGSGTVIIDAKDGRGNITSAVATYTPSSATDQIEYLYPGEDTVAIRANITGSCGVEVI